MTPAAQPQQTSPISPAITAPSVSQPPKPRLLLYLAGGLILLTIITTVSLKIIPPFLRQKTPPPDSQNQSVTQTSLETKEFSLSSSLNNIPEINKPRIILEEIKKMFPEKFSDSRIEEENAIWENGNGLLLLENGVAASKEYYDNNLGEDLLRFASSNIREFFLKNNFSFSQQNTMDQEYGHSTGYELGNIKCKVYLSTLGLPLLFSIECGNLTEHSVDEFSEFAPLNEYPHESYTVIVKNNGLFARGSVRSKFGSGHYWIAKKVDGVWKKIIAGQDIGPCSLFDSENVSPEFYGTCLKEDSTEDCRIPGCWINDN